jgi:hypothetical protein
VLHLDKAGEANQSNFIASDGAAAGREGGLPIGRYRQR